jgi:hypothetical protein
MISGCRAQDQVSAGSQMMALQEAMHHVQDFDAMRGTEVTQVFFPMASGILFANVPLYFQRDNRLTGRKVTSMELVDGTQLATFGGVDMPSSFKNGWVVLRDNCDNLLAEFPMSKLNNVLNGGKNQFMRKLPVDWGKSFLFITDTTGLSSSGFLFNIWTVPN